MAEIKDGPQGSRVEASLANAAVGSRWQLERVGYFVAAGELPETLISPSISIPVSPWK